VIARIQRCERRAVGSHPNLDVIGVEDAFRCVLLGGNPKCASAGDGRALEKIGVFVVCEVDDVAGHQLQTARQRVRRFDARSALQLEAGEVRVILAQSADRTLRVDDLASLDDMDGSFKADELVGAPEHRGAGRDVRRVAALFLGGQLHLGLIG